MRIGIGTTKIEPAVTHGRVDGIGVYVQKLLQYYNLHSYDVLSVSYPPLRNLWSKSSPSSSTYFNAPYSIATAAAFTPFGPLLNSALEKKIDLFHAPDYLIPRFIKIPVVATLHDAIMLKHPEWCNPHLRRLKNFLIKSSIQWADHCIAISHAMVPDLVEYWGVDEKKISVVHQSISDWWLEKASSAEINQVLEKFHLKENYLLSVGTLQPRKNFIRIMQAYDLLPKEMQNEHKLVLIGKDGWQSGEVRKEIARMSAENKVIWLQYVTPDELRALYQSAKLLVFPSLSEGFGLPVLEAFASNIPVITSTTTSLPEVAGDAACLVDPSSVEEIYQGIVTLLATPSLCTELVNRGQARVQQFTFTKCAEETLKIYHKML